jgi:hypothetical protein
LHHYFTRIFPAIGRGAGIYLGEDTCRLSAEVSARVFEHFMPVSGIMKNIFKKI